MKSALASLPVSALRTLASALRDGPLAKGSSRRFIEQVAGLAAVDVGKEIEALKTSGMPSTGIAHMADAIAEAKTQHAEAFDIFDLVVSGPEVPGIPMGDTSAAIQEMVEKAKIEILLVGYAIHNGKEIFDGIAEKMREEPTINVWFCLNIGRGHMDTSIGHEIVTRFATEFRTKHWPFERLPKVYYDPRALEFNAKERASLHAKCVVVDKKVAVITSANFTEAAQKRNIEVGVRVRHEPSVSRLRDYFMALCDTKRLLACPFD